MSLAIAITFALVATPAQTAPTASAPRVTVSVEDRQIVAEAGVLGLLRQLDGDAARLVFSPASIAAPLDGLARILSEPRPAHSEHATRSFGAAPGQGSIAIGAVAVPRTADVQLARRRPGSVDRTLAWNHR